MDQQPSLDATVDSASQAKTIVQRFRQAWKQEQPPVLSKIAAEIPNANSALLAELIAIDLEQRLARGQAIRLEDYLQQFPAVARDGGLVVTLIEQEYALRSSADATVKSHDYLERFPQYREKLSSLFESRATRVREQTTSWGTQDFGNDTRPNVQFEIPAAKIPAKIGRFNVRRWLGSGAFGDVYEAHDPQLDREVAIKVAKLQRGDTELRIKRFLREAKSAAGLRHPNIVPVYEFGQDGELFYIASAYIRGQSLKERSQGAKSLDVAAAVRVTRLLAEALAYSHSQGIVHRDLKPANIMLDEGGTPLLMDFGLASRLDEAEELTQTGQQLGTPLYMSPEQARGKTGATLPASDQYSLGVILYELITGRPPFTGTVEMLMYHQQATEPPPPRQFNRSIARDLETVCLKCLQKSPEKRYPSMAELADDLRRVEVGDPIRARREGLLSKATRRIRRNPIVTAAIVLIAVSLAASSWVWQASQRQREQARIDRQIVELRGKAEQLVTDIQISPSSLKEAEQVLDEIERLQVGSSTGDRQRLHRAYADQITQSFRDRLSPDTIAPIEQAISALSIRDESLAEAVRSEFKQRQTAWLTHLSLRPPFANLEQVFDAKANLLEVSVQGNALGRGPAGSALRAGVASKIPTLSQFKTVAVFDRSWKDVKSRIAVVITGGRGQHYTIVFTPPTEATAQGPRPLSFGEAARRGQNVTLIIDRTHATLTEVVAMRAIPAEDVITSSADGTLRLEVRREGARLSVTINQFPPLEFEDAIPLRAVPGAILHFTWPPELKLQQLTSYQRALPEVASILEEADDAFLRGEYDDALRLYQKVMRETETSEVKDECQYKQGLCFLALDDRQNALEKFAYVANRSPSNPDQLARWAVRANCQLLKQYLSEKTIESYEQANRILDRLNFLRGDHRREIPPLISAKERTKMVYDAGGTGLSLLLRAPDKLVENCERVDRVADLIDASALDRTYSKVTLIRAYRMAGAQRKAILTTSEWIANLENCRAELLFGKDIIAEHVWMLLEQKASPEQLTTALKDVDRYLYASPKIIRHESNRSARDLLVERARLLIALKRSQEAEADLELLLTETHKRRPDQAYPKYVHYAEACLLLGYLQEQRGESAKAQVTWKKSIWRESSAEFFGLSQFPDNGSSIIHHMLLSALTGETGDVDAQRLLINLLSNRQGQSGGNQMMKQMAQFIDLTPQFVKQAWLTPAGMEWSRRIALRDLTFRDFTRAPIYLLVAQYVRQDAFSGELPADQELIVTSFVDESIDQFQLGQLSDKEIILLGSIWKGVNVPGLLGWVQAAPRLPPDLCAYVAALLGHRYLALNRLAEAVTFFEEALKTADKGSNLEKASQAGLAIAQKRLTKETLKSPAPPTGKEE